MIGIHTTDISVPSEGKKSGSCCPKKSLATINISHSTQRAWVVGYTAHARLAVYRIGLA